MKRVNLLTLIIIFFLSINLNKAQSYLPFPAMGAMWTNTTYNVYWIDGNPMAQFSLSNVDYYCISGEDTLINYRTYSKINYCEQEYKGAIRDSMGKVFFVPKDSVGEYLLYDFTVQEGDNVSVYIDYGGIVEYSVSFVDSVLMNGIYRKRISLGGGEWVEGIGNLQGIFQGLGINVSDIVQNLECFSHNDTIIHPYEPNNIGTCPMNVYINEVNNSTTINIYPNPSSDIFIIKGLGNEKVEIYDLTGKIVKQFNFQGSELKIQIGDIEKGVYFVRVGKQTQKLIIE
ncbi:MAG: T9SS type A sorting domain-containing protein [Bacteroidales bacterium]|nr:T9SS type A sorting domain-containing protein [Bacteroidales bacterium]